MERFWSKVDRKSENECWLWLASSGRSGKTHKYGQFKHNGRMDKAHRVAWGLSNSQNIPEGMKILHSCDVPLCCNPKHLVLGTQLDNIRDRNAKGRQAKGTKIFSSKFTPEQVEEIRSIYFEGHYSFRQLGRLFNVKGDTIRFMVKNKTWGGGEERTAEITEIIKKTKPPVPKPPTTKLTDDQVRAVRAAVGTCKEIGKQFGITDVTVSAIKTRKTWKHVDP